MSTDDSLAAWLREHGGAHHVVLAGNRDYFECDALRCHVRWPADERGEYFAHQADVALAWMAGHGWVQGYEEWGVQFTIEEGAWTEDYPSRRMAEREIALSPLNRRLMRRFVGSHTDWEEAK